MAHTLHGTIEIKETGQGQKTTIALDGGSGDIVAGGQGRNGRLILANHRGEPTLELEGQSGDLALNGRLIVTDAAGKPRLTLAGSSGELTVLSAGGMPLARLGRNGNLEMGGLGSDTTNTCQNPVAAGPLGLILLREGRDPMDKGRNQCNPKRNQHWR
jgi:hypothetical protein